MNVYCQMHGIEKRMISFDGSKVTEICHSLFGASF